MHTPTIVCPVDYSDCSKRALRFAGALAEHFCAQLVVLHVFDPLVGGAAALHNFDITGADGEQELQSFVADQLPASVREGKRLARVLALGSPGRKILEIARSRNADLLIMGTHGFSGARKAVFGSTLQGVLRNARVPVLAVPVLDHRDAGIQAPLISRGPVLAPVDFSPESRAAARAALGLSRALGLPLLLLHAVAPRNPLSRLRKSAGGEGAPDGDPMTMMAELVRDLKADIPVESRVVDGEPAEQIARLAREKRSPVIVMSLGSSMTRHRRPGSIAYRVLCLAPVPVLALPETSSGRVYVHHLHEASGSAHAP